MNIYNINVDEFAKKTASAAVTIGTKGWGKDFFEKVKATRSKF